MATQETQILDEVIVNTRRKLLTSVELHSPDSL